MLAGLLALIGLGLALGLRHGIDWDHIAAITDITSSSVTTVEGESHVTTTGTAGAAAAGLLAAAPVNKWQETRRGLFLATMYALGHATLVVLLGLLAIWVGAILPDWIDPLMERLVGVTLVILGVWIFYSLWRYGSSFRLQSRWMLVFALVGRAWEWITNRLAGRPHTHYHQQEIAQYGAGAAFGIGVIHAVGAETGSQALLLAGAAGATTATTGTILLLAFAIGLLASNSFVALFSLASFVSSSTKRSVYVVIGVLAGIFSLVVGLFFIAGAGTALPDLQELLDMTFGQLN